MTEQGLEEVSHPIVRRWIWAFGNDTDAFREILHPDVEWFPVEENHTPYKGVDAAMQVRKQFFDSWANYAAEVEEVIERDDDVVARIHITTSGRTSGAAVDIRFYAQFRVRDDKVILIFDHRDRDAAMEAAGLDQ